MERIRGDVGGENPREAPPTSTGDEVLLGKETGCGELRGDGPGGGGENPKEAPPATSTGDEVV